MEGSSSYNPGNSYSYPYPCPSHVTMKLSSQDTYAVWKTQMLCLLKSHGMLHFIQLETFNGYNYDIWGRSDALVKGWILGSLSDQTLKYVVNSIPNKDFTAKEAWDKLQAMYDLPLRAGLKMLLFAHVPVKLKFVEDTQRKEKAYRDANRLLCLITTFRITSTAYNNAIFEATRQNAVEVVKEIVSQFSNIIWNSNEDGHNIIQHAVINRSENVYNLLYQMSEHKNTYRTIKDPFKNNLLHLAARLAPKKILDPISGAALQIQQELQWFKEVESFVCPLNVIQKNSFGETPQMVFTKEHKKLLIEGEKWMKEAAQSCSITAVLITTIMFAAAITVPGGNKQDSGMPVFDNKFLLSVFAACIYWSFIASIASLLTFLSILIGRFSEQDFLFKLPLKLSIGLATLLLSTIGTLIAFVTTWALLFSKKDIILNYFTLVALIIPFAASIMTSQMSLMFELIIRSIYWKSRFGRRSDEPFC
ncbi:hypothetical protein R6Q59_016415 [Mikania micrantha]